jgi:CDK-activating kinase assembly factor MAT1
MISWKKQRISVGVLASALPLWELTPAFNLLNGIDIEETERRISEFERKNAALLAANKRKAEREQSERSRKDETEKQAKEDRRRMIAEYDELEEREAARVKAEVVQALVSSPEATPPVTWQGRGCT